MRAWRGSGDSDAGAFNAEEKLTDRRSMLIGLIEIAKGRMGIGSPRWFELEA
jgi:hypothetical protein